MNYGLGKWGSGEVGKWGSGEVGKWESGVWGDHFVRVAGGSGAFG